jgi:PAS domain-containing protein
MDAPKLPLDELIARGAKAWREASGHRARAEQLRDRFAALGVFPPRRDRRGDEDAAEHARPPAPDVYRVLFRSAPRPCIWSDRRGVIRDANVAAALLLKMPPPHLVGRELLHFVVRGDTRAFRTAVRALPKDQSDLRLAVRVRPRGGHPVGVALIVKRLDENSYGWFFDEVNAISAPSAVKVAIDPPEK